MTGTILLGHGGGGRLMQQLLEGSIFRVFDNPSLRTRHDGAVLQVGSSPIAFTTDSYVVRPWIFPGGDIGSLAVTGTVNDLAMCGARPAWLSAGLILEEGFSIENLDRVLDSMRRAADECGVAIVTGDTKVVDRGKGDGIYVNTAGIGPVVAPRSIEPRAVRAGDSIVVSGDPGRHAIAVLSSREGIEFETALESDVAPLHGPVLSLLEAGVDLHCLRDLTRGGLAAALVEIAETAQVPIEIEETAVPILEPVRGACEMLGLDPFHLASEGRFIAIMPESDAEKALAALRAHPVSSGAVVIGRVIGTEPGRVVIRTSLRTLRTLDLFSGEQLPRIC